MQSKIQQDRRVREHLVRLRAAGMTRAAIAQQANVSETTVGKMLRIDPEPRVYLRADTARRLLAIPHPGNPTAAGRGLVDRVLIDAAMAYLRDQGWSTVRIATAIGRSPESLRHSLKRERITATTAAAIRQLAVHTLPHDEKSE